MRKEVGDPRPIRLSIVIISFNSRVETLDCLRSVFAHPPSVPFEVILLDNASADGSADSVAEQFPQVNLIRSDKNLGFAAGNNEAVRVAIGELILLLNPDTIVFAGSLTALLNFAASSPERRIWGGRTLFGDYSLNPSSCWNRITLWSLFCSATGLTFLFPKSGLFSPESMGGWLRDNVREVDIVTGCFLLIDHRLWQTLDGFDPKFFMYAEEADLCLRAKALGARPAVTPDAEIVHLGGVSETSAIEKVIKTVRGRVTLMRKHWSPTALFFGLMLYRFWALSRLAGSWIFEGPRDKKGQARQKWQAIWQRRKEWLSGY